MTSIFRGRRTCARPKTPSLIAVIGGLLSVAAALAQDGTWTSTTNGLWSNSSNWSGGTVANGAGFTANFTLDLPDTDLTVNLDSSRTIGNLTFTDTDPSTGLLWTLANNGSLGNVLTLSGTTPTITSDSWLLISTVIAGSDGLHKAGASRLELTQANTYSGGTTINSGEILVSNTSALGTGAVTLAGGVGAQLTFGTSGSFANSITFLGTGTLAATPGGSNTSTATGSVVLNGTTTLAVLNTSTLELSGSVSGSGGFSRLSGNAATVVKLSGSSANTYTGTTTINAGILALNKTAGVTAVAGAVSIGASGTMRLDASNQIADTSALTIAGTFNVNGRSESIGSLTGAGTVSLGGGSLAVGGANTSTSFTGAITGTGTLNKYGSGTFTLSGANSFSGGASVSAGTLTLGSSTTLTNATGTLTVNGGTLNSSVSATTLGGHLTLSSGSLSPRGNSAGSFTLASGKNFTMSGGTLNLTLGSSFDQIASAGSGLLSLTGGTIAFDTSGTGFSYANSYQIFSGFGSSSFSGLSLAGYDSTNYLASISNAGVLSFSAIPEPSTYAAIAGALALGMAAWRRKSRSAR